MSTRQPKRVVPPRNSALTALEKQWFDTYVRNGRDSAKTAKELGVETVRVSMKMATIRDKGFK